MRIKTMKWVTALIALTCAMPVQAVYTIEEGDLETYGLFSSGELNYRIVSETEKTCEVANVGQVKAEAPDMIAWNVATLTVPANVTNEATSQTYRVIGIGEYGIYGNQQSSRNKTKSVIVSEGIEYLADNALTYMVSATSITLPSTLKAIGSSALLKNSAITSIAIPDGVTVLPQGALQNCAKLKTVTIPASVKSFGISLFSGCKALQSVTVPDGVSEIPNYCFENCSKLTWPDLPPSVKRIGRYAFSSCSNLGKIVIPEGVETIDDYAFNRAGESSISVLSFPGSLRTIGAKAFNRTINPMRISKIVFNRSEGNDAPLELDASIFPKDISGIELEIYRDIKTVNPTEALPSAFGMMPSLGSLTIGEKVSMLPSFAANESIYSIRCLATVPPTGAEFSDKVYTNENLLLNVPEGSRKAYATAEGWKPFFAGEVVTEPSPVNGYVDLDKLGYTVGSGSLKGALVISWNDTLRGVDHLVWGVNFDKGTSAQQIVDMVVDADSRLYRIERGYAYDNLDKKSLNEKYDHYSADDDRCSWRICSDEELTDGSVVYLTFTDGDASSTPAAPEYTFYIPEEGKLGAWIPDGYRCPIADNMTFPVWARSGEYGTDYVTVTLDPSRPFVEQDNGAFKAEKQAGYAMITLAPNVERFVRMNPECYDVNVTCSLWPKEHQLGDDDPYHLTLSSGSSRKMSIVPPTRPVTKINDKITYVPGKLATTPLKDLVDYEPKDATYTGFRFVDYESGAVINTYYDETIPGYQFWVEALEVKSGAKNHIFTVNSILDENIKGLVGFTVNDNPVTDVRLAGVEGDGLTLELHDILALRAEVTPANATNKAVAFKIENPSSENMATTYGVGGSEKFTELVTYRPGTFDLTLTSVENPAVTATYHVTVNPLASDETTGDHTEGTFWLNEEWFTHKNGSISYLKTPLPESESEILYHAYSRNNDDACFGATSQYGMIFADKLFVMSKQAEDAGDIRHNGGGRLVVADANSLKCLASFDEIGGDGRACVGVDSHKAYIGTHSGIRTLTWDDGEFTLATSNIPGINNDTQNGGTGIGDNQALYNKQIGDMVKAGAYVFAIQQGVGVHVIDTATDTAVSLIGDPGVQGITQTADGHVWFATSTDAAPGHSYLREIDPQSAEVISGTEVPGTISCSWGSWRSTNFFASKSDNILFWNGGSADITSAGGTIYRWNTYEDASDLQPLYEMPKKEGTFHGVYQQMYASMRLDDRTGAILFATTTSPSGNYRYNWLNFIDSESGEEITSIRLKDYYWFPSIPIFPDVYAPEFRDIEPIELKTKDDSYTLRLDGLAHDEDNIDFNVSVSRVAEYNDSVRTSTRLEEIAAVEEKDGAITITPRKAGKSDLVLRAESNGREAYAYVPVSVSVEAGVDNAACATRTLSVVGNKVLLKGFDGETFIVSDMTGAVQSSFTAHSDECSVTLMLGKGVYVISDSEGTHSIKFTL